jgi:uncharacterized protein (TIGR00255 family)
MTGFGKASKSINKNKIEIELRSVNSKYFDISYRLPLSLADKEPEIKEIISQKISRGKIIVSFTVNKVNSKSLNIEVNKKSISDITNILKTVRKISGIKDDIKLEHILKYSELFKPEMNNEINYIWNDIKKVLQQAVSDLLKMKIKEGLNLKKDIIKRLTLIDSVLNKVNNISEKNIAETKKRLINNLNLIIKDTNIKPDSSRIEQELFLISDRLDITEEIIRAKSHIQYSLNSINNTNELSGRKLGFIMQELNREINTIASKSNNSKISQYVVELKEELEKIKEQIQNIE